MEPAAPPASSSSSSPSPSRFATPPDFAFPQPLASTLFLRALMDAAARMGAPCAELADAMAEIDEQSIWIPASTITRAWEVVPELSGDPFFGLHAAEQMPFGVYGYLDFETMRRESIGDAIERLAPLYARMAAMSELVVRRDEDGSVRVQLVRRVYSRTDLRHYVEYVFALIVTRAEAAVVAPIGSNGVRIDMTVQFTHTAPPDAIFVGDSPHMRIFGPNVSFNAPIDELWIGAKSSALRLRTKTVPPPARPPDR